MWGSINTSCRQLLCYSDSASAHNSSAQRTTCPWATGFYQHDAMLANVSYGPMSLGLCVSQKSVFHQNSWIYLLRKVSFGWIKRTNTNFIENNQKVIYFWRFDLNQRPSSEEAGTRSSSSGSWRDKLESSQESGRTYDWVGSSLRPGSWIVPNELFHKNYQ